MKTLIFSFTSNGVESVTIKLYRVTNRDWYRWQVRRSRPGESTELLGEFENRQDALEKFRAFVNYYL